MEKINISVIIPTYNEEKNISKLIKALLSQSFLPDEIIISDGCSTDNTLKIVHDLFKDNDLIKVINRKGKCRGSGRNEGIMSAKNTHNLIPLCHPIPLSKIDLNIEIIRDESKLTVESTVKANWNTGVEMEALTAVSVAALTIYDMCKSIDKAIEIRSIKLIKKSGGNSGDFINK